MLPPKVFGEQLKINPRWCAEYARDGQKAAAARAAGSPRQTAESLFDQGAYLPHIWPHVVQLIDRAYASDLSPNAFGQHTFDDCIQHGGLIDRES